VGTANGGKGGNGGDDKGGYGKGRDGVDVAVDSEDNLRRKWGLDLLADRDGVDVVAPEDRVVVSERARRLVDRRDYDRAALEYDRLLVDDPDNVHLLRNRAHTY